MIERKRRSMEEKTPHPQKNGTMFKESQTIIHQRVEINTIYNKLEEIVSTKQGKKCGR